MEAFNTKAKIEDKRRLLMERRAKLKVLLDNEMKQLEVYTSLAYRIAGNFGSLAVCLHNHQIFSAIPVCAAVSHAVFPYHYMICSLTLR